METISLKLPKDVLKQTEVCAKALGIPGTEYIRRALERMDREFQLQADALHFADVSRRVRAESMRVNREFARIQRDPVN